MNAKSEEVKIVYVDGTLKDGVVRSIRGKLIEENESAITIERNDGKLTIGRNFIVKIERWSGERNEHGIK